MKRLLILLSVATLVGAGAASGAVQKGDTELDFLGGFTTQNATDGGPDIDSWFLSGGVGYFLTDNIQVAGVAMGAWTEVTMGGASIDIDIYGIGGKAKYHFMPTNQWVPYVGVQALWAAVDLDAAGDADGMLWGPLAGLRYELNAYNDFFVEYQYQLWEGDIADAPVDGGAGLDDGHTVFVGIVHQFK